MMDLILVVLICGKILTGFWLANIKSLPGIARILITWELCEYLSTKTAPRPAPSITKIVAFLMANFYKVYAELSHIGHFLFSCVAHRGIQLSPLVGFFQN